MAFCEFIPSEGRISIGILLTITWLSIWLQRLGRRGGLLIRMALEKQKKNLERGWAQALQKEKLVCNIMTSSITDVSHLSALSAWTSFYCAIRLMNLAVRAGLPPHSL